MVDYRGGLGREDALKAIKSNGYRSNGGLLGESLLLLRLILCVRD